MTRFLVDEDFNNDILPGIRRRQADLEAARVQDVGLLGADDDTVLATAAAEGRLLQAVEELAQRFAAERRPCVRAVVISAFAVLAPSDIEALSASLVVDAAIGLFARVSFLADGEVCLADARSGSIGAAVALAVIVSGRLAQVEGDVRVIDTVKDDCGYGPLTPVGSRESSTDRKDRQKLVAVLARELVGEERTGARASSENAILVDAILGFHGLEGRGEEGQVVRELDTLVAPTSVQRFHVDDDGPFAEKGLKATTVHVATLRVRACLAVKTECERVGDGSIVASGKRHDEPPFDPGYRQHALTVGSATSLAAGALNDGLLSPSTRVPVLARSLGRTVTRDAHCESHCAASRPQVHSSPFHFHSLPRTSRSHVCT
jgi:hypothetical protein